MAKQYIRKIWTVTLAAAMTMALGACSEKEENGASVNENQEEVSESNTNQNQGEDALTIAFCQMGNYNTWRIAETEL